MKKNKILLITSACLCLFLLIFLLDYNNCLTRIGMRLDRINMNAEGIVINTFTTVALFLLAYYLVDRWGKKQYDNKRAIAYQLIKTAYKECEERIEYLDDPKNREIMITIKNLEGCIEKDYILKYMRHFFDYETLPFQTDEYIMQLCTDGIIDATDIQNYIEIKELYTSYMFLLFANDKSGETKDYLSRMKDRILAKTSSI